MGMELLGRVVTIVLFGVLGWILARRRRRPAGPAVFMVLVVVAVAGAYVGTGARLLDVGGFRIALNWAIVAACLGAAVQLLRRGATTRRAP